MNGWKRPLESVRGAKTLLMYRSGKKYSREGSRTFNSVQRDSFYRWSDDDRSKNGARDGDGRLIVESFGCRPDFSKEN